MSLVVNTTQARQPSDEGPTWAGVHMDSRLAVSVMPLENRRETLIDIATTADRLGYNAFFLPERHGSERRGS